MNLKKPIWFNKNIKKELVNFLKLYQKRPIKNNIHGMRINHMFSLYFILKKIRPNFVIESGVYRGQSTWLIEKTLPKTKIIFIAGQSCSCDEACMCKVFFSNRIQQGKPVNF
jgi:hypothetical protein